MISGKAVKLRIIEENIFLTEKDYHMYLFNLRINEENDLLAKSLKANENTFMFHAEFDFYVKEMFYHYEREKVMNDQKIFDDIYVSSLMKVTHYLSRHTKTEKNVIKANNYSIMGIESYIEKLKPKEEPLFCFDPKKEVKLYFYEICEYIRTGDIFGNYFLESGKTELR